MSDYTHDPAFHAREEYVPVEHARLFCRAVGQGQPIIVVHGGPDFDHGYLLPDMDRLADSFRLVYYDQRGRGRSAAGVRPQDVSVRSEIDDLERVRHHLGLESVALLGHSWGGLLAMEYAIRHPGRVSHLMLMHTGPASRAGYELYRQARRTSGARDLEELKALSLTAGYREGQPEAVADYYRVHFRSALRQPEHLDRLIESLRAGFSQEGILKGREIEERLMAETWLSSDYDLLPRLASLRMQALIIHGDHDLIPVECAAQIAEAIPAARFVVLPECGHFSYLESPDEVRHAIIDLFHEV